MPEKTQKLSWSEKFSNAAKLFQLYFCASQTKSTFQAPIKPEILSTLGLNPTRKTQLDLQRWVSINYNFRSKLYNVFILSLPICLGQ